MNKHNYWQPWFWGVFLIACAGTLGASQLGWLPVHLGFWTILLTIILVGATIANLINLSIGGTIFGLAFLGMLYAKPLGISALTPWTILAIALLLTIGLSLIFRPFQKRRWKRWASQHVSEHIEVHDGTHQDHVRAHYSTSTGTDDESHVNFAVSLGSAVRYVQSPDFQSADISASLGEIKVYFDDATILGDSATITVSGTASQISLYIPRTWNTILDVQPMMGEVTEVGHSDHGDTPRVYINGGIKMGEVTVNYI